MIQIIDNKYITEINPDFIYNRFDLFCENYIVIKAEQGKEKHIIEARIFDNYAELGIWKMTISSTLIKELSAFLFQKFPNIEYTKFFFCKTDGAYKLVKHFSIDLPDSKEIFLQRKSSKSRHRLDNQRRQAERDCGNITYHEYKCSDCPKNIIQLYNIWKEKSHHIGIIENAESFFFRFHISNISTLSFGDNIVAILFSCEQCSVAYLDNLSFDIQFAKYSPGQQIYEFFLTRLIEKKIKKVFLGGGDYEYKRKYHSIEEKLYDGIICRNIYQKIRYNLITYYNKSLYWKVKKIKNLI